MSDVFERLRDSPEPALRPSAEVLADARRSTRRRTAARAGATAIAVLAIAGGASVAVNQIRSPVGPDAASAPSSTAAAAPAAPTAGAVDRHSASIARTLIDVVPPDYQAVSVGLTGEPAEPPTVYTARLDGNGAYRAIALVRITDQHGAGMISAVYGNDLPAVPLHWTDLPSPVAEVGSPTAPVDVTEPCSTHLDLGIEGATATYCGMRIVGDVPVRVVTGTDPGGAIVMSATRYLRGGYVVVSASQALRTYQVGALLWQAGVNPNQVPPLFEPPFTPDQLARLAASPNLLP